MDNVLPKLVKDVHALLGNNFVFQQDGAPAHGAMRTQKWLYEHCPRLHWQGFVAAKQPGFKSAGLLHVGSNARGIQQVQFETTEHFWAEDSFADDLR